MSRKIVVNRCYGGFSLSHTALRRLLELKQAGNAVAGLRVTEVSAYFVNDLVKGLQEANNENEPFSHCVVQIASDKFVITWRDTTGNRIDPSLVRVVEELNDKANGPRAELEVIEIPDDFAFEIDTHDGFERVIDPSRVL